MNPVRRGVPSRPPHLPPPRAAASLAVAALALVGCGPGEVDGRDTAGAWISAINARDWSRGCRLMERRSPSCPPQMKDTYDPHTYRLLPPGSFRYGGRTTDNRTFFIALAEDKSFVAFEVRARTERQVIAPMLVDQRASPHGGDARPTQP